MGRPLSVRSRVVLAAFLILTVLLAWARRGLETDVENRSLKAPGTPEAEANRRRRERFGEDAAVVVLVARGEASADAPWSAGDDAQLERWRGALADSGVLEGLREVPSRERAWRAFAGRLVERPDARSGSTWVPSAEALAGAAERDLPPGWRARASGLALYELGIARAVELETGRVVAWVVLALSAALLVVYRSPAALAAVLLPAAAGIVWTGGLFALCGRHLDPVAVLLNPVLLTVGVAGAIHTLERYAAERAAGRAPFDAAHAVRADLLRPTALTTLTTVIGFASLVGHPIPAVADFGAFAALGASLTALFALALSPWILAWSDRGLAAPRQARRRARWDAWAEAGAHWIAARVVPVRLAALALVPVCAWQWSRLEVDNDPARILPSSNQTRRAAELATRALGGSDACEVSVDAASAWADPQRLGVLAADFLARPGVAGPLGPALRSAGGDVLLSTLLEPGGSRARSRLFDDFDRRQRALGEAGVHLAGTSVQVVRDSLSLIRGQARGYGLTLVAMFLVFAAAFGSLRVGALALLPNLLPGLVVYAALGAAGRPVTVATAMISSVMLGLIVDDTIHLLHRFRGARAAGLEPTAALTQALRVAGHSVVVTSSILAFGFLCGTFGELETSREFGALAALTIAAALAADLLLLPALLLPARARAEPARG